MSAARNFGVVFKERTPNTVTVEVMGEPRVHELLCILDFNNVRRRMSVVFRENGRIRLYCKGADSVIFDRLEPGDDEHKATMLRHLNVRARPFCRRAGGGDTAGRAVFERCSDRCQFRAGGGGELAPVVGGRDQKGPETFKRAPKNASE